MSGKLYTLTIAGAHVSMPLVEFVSLASELHAFGVDVEVQKDSTPGEITFALKETVREQ